MENLYAKSLFRKGGIKCFAVADKFSFKKKIASVWRFDIKEDCFAKRLSTIVQNAYCSQELKDIATREFGYIDCRYVCKGDALGFISKVAKNETDPIVVIENITQIPAEDTTHDNPNYVANLLLNSWKNDDIYADNIYINRRNITVILTCPVEEQEKLIELCKTNSYSWCGEFNEWIKGLEDIAIKKAENVYNKFK